MNNTKSVSQKLKRSLVEWHEFKLPPLIPRNIGRLALAKNSKCPSSNQITADREMKGLLGAMNAYKLKQGYILTNDEHADLERDGKKIFIRPLWHFSLNRSAF